MEIYKIFFIVLLVGLIVVSGCIQQSDQQQTKLTQEKFSCENDNSIQTRGYVLLMGLADHTKEGWIVEKKLMEQDPKSKFVLIYDQDENSHLEDISQKFLADMDDILRKNPVDELVIFGSSAGGVTSSYSISRLNFSGQVALHTLASPLNGYDFRGVGEAFLGERSVYEKEIALGLSPFQTPGKNVKVYHHKTVTDTILKDYYCRNFSALCDPIKIQNNNIEGSKEFYYPQYDHNPLGSFVIREVLKCYNPGIFEALKKEEAILESGETLGSLCMGEENCQIFCHTNRGRCNDYCGNNPENALCTKIFSNKEYVKNQPLSASTESDLLTDQIHECRPVGNHQYYRTDNTFVIDPTDPNTMYVNVEHKGFFKSTDGGKTWELKTKGIKAYAQKDDPTKPCHGEYPVTVIDPNNPKHIVLALSGTPSNFDFGWTKVGGLVESWDGAESWQQMIQGWMNIYVTDVAIDPADSKTIYYTTAAQPATYTEADPNKIFVTKGLVYKTSDGGNSWEELNTGFFMNAAAVSIDINSKNPEQIFVTTFTDSRQNPGQPHTTENVTQMGHLKSLDGGKTWKAIHSLPTGFEGIRESAASPKNFLHVFVSPFSPSDSYPKSFYSTDGGQTFKESSIFVDFARHDPHDESGNHLLGYQRTTMGSDLPGIYESNDAGATWRKISDAPKEILENRNLLEQASNIVWEPKNKNIVYLTGAGGYIWKSSDGGKTWEVLLSLEKLNGSPTQKVEERPVLKNLGVKIEPWDKTTNKAGNLIFSKKLLFDDGYVSNDKVFIDFGHKEKYRPNDIGSIEYWFFVPLDTKLKAPTDGFVQIVFFNHTQDWGINIGSEGSDWIVSFEHIVNVKVKEGDIVKAGDIVAEAAPRSTFNNEIAMTELAVWTSGQSIIKYCPFNFLEESLKPIYEKKIKKLASDWEEFIGKNVYKQEDWVAPGCLAESIKER